MQPVESVRLVAGQLCVQTIKGENQCDWKYISLFDGKMGGGKVIEYNLVEGKMIPVGWTETKSAELYFQTGPGIRGEEAELLFPGVSKSDAKSFRLGTLGTATIR